MRLRVLGTIMGVTLLVLGSVLVPLALYLHANAYSSTLSSLEKSAFVLAARSSAFLWAPTDAAQSDLAKVADTYSDESGARVIVTDSAGRAVLSTDEAPTTIGTSFASRPEIRTALTGTVATGERYSNTLKDHLVYVAVPVLSGSTVLGSVRLTFAAEEIEGRLNDQLALLWGVALSALALAAISGLILATSVTIPLRRLRTAAADIADGNLERRSSEREGAPEIRSLAQTFNQMADRLSGLLEEQRRFSADAAHQLRTPLTALRLRLESARALLRDDSDRAEARIVAAEAEAERLHDLVESLLQLSRGELDHADRIDVDVAAIANATVEAWSPLASESGIRLHCTTPAVAPAFALDQAVEQILGNLIDNAIRASRTSGRIDVVVDLDGEWVRCTVSDVGVGLSAEERELAFTRYWSGTEVAGGTGIGLTIVQRLVQSSGGEVWLEANEPTGIRAIFRLPAVHSA